MHPALRKGPLFYQKTPPFSTFLTKPHFPPFLQNTPIFHFLTKSTPPISFPAYGLAEARSSCHDSTVGNESVPIQLAQCWFYGPAISNAKTNISFSNKIHGSNFIEQHAETAMV